MITNTKYALKKCLEYVELMVWALKETENKRLYAYYIEAAVYQNLVLWDMFKKLLNEFYRCGYSESDNISIFKLLKEKKSEISKIKVNRILKHLNCNNHSMVRKTLRNSFTHSVEATSPYVFHRINGGKIQAQTDYLLPRHPFEYINFVIMDILKLIEFMKEIVNEMYEYRNTNLILLKVRIVMPCGKVIDDSEYWNLGSLKEKYEKILVHCDSPCGKAIYNEANTCKPIKINYQRIYSKQEKTAGILTPTLTYEEIISEFGENKDSLYHFKNINFPRREEEIHNEYDKNLRCKYVKK